MSMKIDTNQPLASLLNIILNHALSSIGAKAGSLMTVNKMRGILQIRARLGIPREGRRGEPEYDIDGNSIASQSVKNRKWIVKNNLSKESTENYVSSRSKNEIKSILSVPIIHDDEVIAVINADSEEINFFKKKIIKKLNKIAKEVAPLIAERISFLDALKEVSMELSKTTAEGDVDKVLQKISDVAVKSLGIDIVTLYEYDQSKDEFIIESGGPKIGGTLIDESRMRTKVEKKDVPYHVSKERKGPLFYKNVNDVDFLTKKIKRKDEGDRPRFIERENIKSMAAFLLPNRAYKDRKEEVVGVLFANYKKEHDFNVDEQDALATFADYAATAILTSRKEKQRREDIKKLERSRGEKEANVWKEISHRTTHKMGNAIFGLEGDIELLDIYTKTSPINIESLKTKIKAAKRSIIEAKIILNDAKNVINPKPLNLETLDISPYLKSLVNESKKSIKQSITIQCEIAKYLPKVKIDPVRFKHILREIIENASNFIKENDTIVVKAHIATEQELNKIETISENKKYISIMISDTGLGVPLENKTKIFYPYFSTRGQGAGLGLAIVKEYIEKHGGQILEIGEYLKGAKFLIIIPVK